jgi:hypothetical protein
MEVVLPSSSSNEPAIHRLVDDILAYIFLLNATPPDPDADDLTTVEHATTVASSQVCTRWRSIALNCHTIWGLIIDYPRHSLKWIEKLLDRSHPSLLDFGSRIYEVLLDVFVDDGHGQGVLELVFNHVDRLRIFNTLIPTRSTSCELLSSRFLQMPAPNLEFMHIFLSDIGHLTHPLFDNHAPNLRNLRLSRCTIDFTSPVLTPLTELHVDIGQENTHLTLLDWLNILRGMPSLQSVCLNRSISSGSPGDILPDIHLDALDMLSVDSTLHECVTLVKHLIVPPRCGLSLRCDHAYLGSDQRQLWAIIEKKMDSWAKNASYRRLDALASTSFVQIGNLPREDEGWESKEVDPVMSIALTLPNSEETIPVFHSLFALFERTFFDTICLELWIYHNAAQEEGLFYHDPPVQAEAFLPLVDMLRGFVNLEKLNVGYHSLPKLLFSLLQQANSVLLPKIKTLFFYDVTFQEGSDSILRVGDFLKYRREQGFPIEKIVIEYDERRINKEYVLKHIQDTLVEMDD